MTRARIPLVVILAGPNGAGKSTGAAELLRGAFAVQEFVNADTIAAGLSAYRPESIAVAAGRIMLDRLRELAARAWTSPSKRRSLGAATLPGCALLQVRATPHI